MIRTAIATALLAAVPLLCFGDDGNSKAAGPQQEQQQQQQQNPPNTDKKTEAPPAAGSEQKPAGPESISPVIPVAPGAAAESPDAAKLAGAAAVGTVGAKPAGGLGIDTKTYIIGAEDQLEIIVFENSQFSVPNEMVRPDGKVTLPLLGEFVASGKTPEELEKEISERLLKDYMTVPPHVSVVVLVVNSKHYFINGEVNKPGRFALVVPTTVMQALTEAGGFRDFANKTKIRIQHSDGTMDTFNYKDVEKGKNLKQNIYLKPGDAIYVH